MAIKGERRKAAKTYEGHEKIYILRKAFDTPDNPLLTRC
jgi:hypothetical protein